LITHTDPFGNKLAIGRKAGAYVVGTVSSQGRFRPLGPATFATVQAALQQFEQEARRGSGDGPVADID
jgi:hypothetical protein